MDNLLYVGDWGNGGGVLSILDVADPTQPRLIGSYASTSAEIQGLAVDGGRAYLANDSLGLTMVDVSDSSHPRLFIATSAHTRHVGGLHIVDVSDARAPRSVGDLDLSDLGNVSWEGVGLDVAGSRAYIVGKSALHVLDVADPRHPVEKATLHLPPAYANGIGGNVVVQGDYVYAAVSALQSIRGAVVVFKADRQP